MPPAPLLMLLVFALSLFASATLLFLVEPMVGKMVLPLLGGTPAVWNTCMVFFQAVLLAGYAYAHATAAWLGARKQALLHLAVLLVPLVFFFAHGPLAIDRDLVAGRESSPVPAVLLVLTLSVGLPLFVLSTTAPLLQHWFASTAHPAARDPYFLYGASNLGSLLALLAYPAVVEPHLRLAEQRFGWAVGYGVLVALVAACAAFLWLSPPAPAAPAEKAPPPAAPGGDGKRRNRRDGQAAPHPDPAAVPPGSLRRAVTWPRRLRWLALAAVPSSLMLGATSYITTDIAAIPLLWVLPLGLYLLSFIIVFARLPPPVQGVVHGAAVRLMPLLALLTTFLMLSSEEIKMSIGSAVALHLTVLFAAALVCHGELARDRPGPRRLTEYYLWMSVGGVVGGLFNALLAPWAFNGLVEYPLAMVAACLLLPGSSPGTKGLLARAAAGVLSRPFAGPGRAAWRRGALPGGAPEEREGTRARRGEVFLAVLSVLAGVVLLLVRVPDEDIHLGGLATPDWLWALAGLGLAAAAGVGLARRAPARCSDRWLDLALPLALGVLLVGLFFGLTSQLFWPGVKGLAAQAELTPGQMSAVLVYGLPAVLCCTFLKRALRFGLGLGAVLLASAACAAVNDPPLFQKRSFFGVLKVQKRVGRYAGAELPYRRLLHGTTMHGLQFTDPGGLGEPLAYYHRAGPIGHVCDAYNTDPRRGLGVIGLGAGSMTAYGLPGQHLTFYDIDQVVRDIAFGDGRFFTYVADARKRGVHVDLVLGDARLTLERRGLAEDQKYGILVVDAFSSDSIPMHLITREALRLYLGRVAEDGLICFHTSNRYLRLEPVLANLARAEGLAGLIEDDLSDNAPGKVPSRWVVLARKPEYLKRLLTPTRWEGEQARWSEALLPLCAWPDGGAGLGGQAMLTRGLFQGLEPPAWKLRPPGWKPLRSDPKVGVWTDDYSNLLSVFTW